MGFIVEATLVDYEWKERRGKLDGDVYDDDYL